MSLLERGDLSLCAVVGEGTDLLGDDGPDGGWERVPDPGEDDQVGAGYGGRSVAGGSRPEHGIGVAAHDQAGRSSSRNRGPCQLAPVCRPWAAKSVKLLIPRAWSRAIASRR
jgi:hypothetical protein